MSEVLEMGRTTGVWAVVPVKGFARGKTRLSSVLNDGVRCVFARGLFEHVFSTLRATPGIAQVVVLTDDDEVASLAAACEAHVLRDPEAATLASIIDAGFSYALRHGASAALVCMADLPNVSSADIASVLQALREHRVVIAPDDAEAGTNLLALSPPDLFPSRFGREDSFAQHLASAAERTASMYIIRAPGLCFDVDDPRDLPAIDVCP